MIRGAYLTEKLIKDAQLSVRVRQQERQISEMTRALNDAIADIQMLAQAHDALVKLLVERGVVPPPEEFETVVQ